MFTIPLNVERLSRPRYCKECSSPGTILRILMAVTINALMAVSHTVTRCATTRPLRPARQMVRSTCLRLLPDSARSGIGLINKEQLMGFKSVHYFIFQTAQQQYSSTAMAILHMQWLLTRRRCWCGCSRCQCWGYTDCLTHHRYCWWHFQHAAVDNCRCLVGNVGLCRC